MLEVPHSRALVLFTESPVPQTWRFAPVPEEPCPPVIRKPLRLDALLVVRELALKEVLAVMVACFPLSAVTMLVPATVSDPPIVAFPPTASVEFKTAAPVACSSRVAMTSRPCTSALHVTLATLTTELVVNAACFPEMVVLRSTPAK